MRHTYKDRERESPFQSSIRHLPFGRKKLH